MACYTAGRMIRRVVVAVAVAVATLACSAPPEKERQQAEAALSSARTAGAALYAPEPMKLAETAFAQYDAAVTQRDYRQALRLALEARDWAYEASKLAAENKAAAKLDAEHLRAELATLIETATARLGGGAAAPRFSAAMAERARAAITSAKNTLQEADAQIATQDYRAVSMALTAALADLHRDLEPPAPIAPPRAR